MSSDHQKNSASTAELRPMRNGGFHRGQCSSIFEDLEYGHSNSNRKLDPSTDNPPPYEMTNTDGFDEEAGISLQSMRPQPDEGQPTIRPAIKHLSWRFCKYLQPAPLLTFNFTFPYASGNFAFNLTFKYITLAILAFCFCFWAWVSWSRSKTP